MAAKRTAKKTARKASKASTKTTKKAARVAGVQRTCSVCQKKGHNARSHEKGGKLAK